MSDVEVCMYLDGHKKVNDLLPGQGKQKNVNSFCTILQRFVGQQFIQHGCVSPPPRMDFMIIYDILAVSMQCYIHSLILGF
jgi:hypothetical protein